MNAPARAIAGLSGRSQPLAWRDVAATALVLAAIVLAGIGARQMAAPLDTGHPLSISLDPARLPLYALRTTLRMLVAMAASLLFTLSYATLAAKSRHAETVLVPLLDVLQSVPILGYLSFTVVFFVALFPHRQLGAECAAIFAIFTSQAWNMAFSFYQSLKTVPHDLDEASRSFRSSGWQRFWRLEVPFAMPGLVWNMMMSMSGGWFFVVAAEAISVGDIRYTLPGVGSYVALAIADRDLGAVGWAITAMTLVIVACDQLLFRPLVTWADRFRFEQSAAAPPPHSWVYSVFQHSTLARRALGPAGSALVRATRARLEWPSVPAWLERREVSPRVAAAAWATALAGGAAWTLWLLATRIGASLTLADLAETLAGGALTLLRVVVLIVLATLVWVPVGIAIGLRPRVAAAVQPLAQFLAAFPANLLFPVTVYLVLRFGLSPRLWLSPLMILGTQWYILFNVIAGAAAFPGDLREAARSLRVRPVTWWRRMILPGIFPYYVTGAITASGGAWNASIVAEAVSWGSTRLDGGGLGAYIARMTLAGDFARVALGVAVMSMLVIAMNRLLWRPLYALAGRRTRLD